MFIFIDLNKGTLEDISRCPVDLSFDIFNLCCLFQDPLREQSISTVLEDAQFIKNFIVLLNMLLILTHYIVAIILICWLVIISTEIG